MSMDSITFTVDNRVPGVRRVHYEGTDHLAQKHPYGPVVTTDVGYDPEVRKVGILAKMDDRVKEDEVETWLADEELAVTNVHATKQRHASTWRARYKAAIKNEHFRLGYKLYRDYLLGNFTDAQLQTAWSMTPGDTTAFLGRIQTAHDHWIVSEAGVGE